MYIKNTSWIQLKFVDRMLIPIYHYYEFVFVILMFYLLSSWPNQRPTWTMYCTVGGRKPRSLTSKERPRKSQKRLNTLSESIWYVANTTLQQRRRRSFFLSLPSMPLFFSSFLFIFFFFWKWDAAEVNGKTLWYPSSFLAVVGCSQDKRRRVWRFAKSLSTFRSGSGRDSQLQRIRKTS